MHSPFRLRLIKHLRGSTKPLAALLTLFLFVGLGSACCLSDRASLPRQTIGRTVEAEWAAAVVVKTSCSDGSGMWGTGVIVSKNIVLTARHVVAESAYYGKDEISGEDLWRHCPGRKVMIAEVDGKIHNVTVEGESYEHDVARLRSEDDFEDAPAILGPKPSMGETVCAVALVPHPWRRCGTIQFPKNADALRFDFRSEHGNSGSGIYDSAGRLVGILTLQERGEDAQIVGGDGTDLSADGVRFLFPE